MLAILLRGLSPYSYAETGYANPHAVTSVGGTTYAYDNNGNVTSAGNRGYEWDYRNRLTAAGTANGTTTYGYDHTGQRVFKADGTATTSYPNMYFNTDGSTVIKHFLTPDGTLLAVVSSTTGGGGESLSRGMGLAGDSTGQTAMISEEASQSVLPLLEGKTTAESADLKAAAIAARVPTGEYDDATYGLHIEIQNIEKITGGVQILARAWKEGKPLGFGADGSVEIERFRIFNPPILVDDPDGSIVREWTDGLTGQTVTRHLREDPASAIRSDLAHTISLVGKEGTAIVPGKVGNTTDTFRPDAGHTGTTVDGRIAISGQATFAAARDATSGSCTEPDTANTVFAQVYRNGAGLYQMGRGFFLFDTSPLGSDTVDSATFSAYVTSVADSVNDGDDFVSAVASSPASNNNLVEADWDNVATTEMHGAAERKDLTGLGTGYKNWTFNATGKAAVVNGISKFALREGHDLLNSGWSGGTYSQNDIDGYYADQAGADSDPKLVVEHHHSGQGSPSMTYIHTDHLGGTNVVTDANGAIVQTLDYYPYGSQRIATGSFDEQRRFTGHEYDAESDLTYANARYYGHNAGEWLSQDPASRDNLEQFLNDPQQLNGYAYSRNNPIRFLDVSGAITIEFSRPVQGFAGHVASHNAIAGYNVPGFPNGVMTIAGYSTGGPAAYDRLAVEVGQSGEGRYSGVDYKIAEQIFKGDISGTRGFSLIRDFGGLSEEDYWKKMIEAGDSINNQGVPYSAISQNCHSALQTMKTYANATSPAAYHPSVPWLGLPWLAPAAGNYVLQHCCPTAGLRGEPVDSVAILAPGRGRGGRTGWRGRGAGTD